MWWCLVLASCLVATTQAYAPIQWIKFPARKFVVTPVFFSPSEWTTPQKLMVSNQLGSMSPSMTAFNAEPDQTITWSSTGWCLEAFAQEVQLNRCTGEPAQKWDMVPDSHGRKMIKLQHSNQCLDVLDNEGSLHGSPLSLRPCEAAATESWVFEDPPPASTASTSSMLYLIVPFAVAAMLGIWLGKQARGLAMIQRGMPSHADVGGTPLCVPLPNPQRLVPSAMALSPTPNMRDKANDRSRAEMNVANLNLRDLPRHAGLVAQELEVPDSVPRLETRKLKVYFPELGESVAILESPGGTNFSAVEMTHAASFPTETRFWPASFAAASAVLRMILQEFQYRITNIRLRAGVPVSMKGGGVHVVELCCGCGLPSLAALRTGAKVTSVDYSPAPLDLVSRSAALQPDGASQRHNVVKFDLRSDPLRLLDELKPDIVVVDEAFYGDSELAASVGRFLAAAAVKGAGIVASAEAGAGWERGWEKFFQSFNESVQELFTKDNVDAKGKALAGRLRLPSAAEWLDKVKKVPIPESIPGQSPLRWMMSRLVGRSADVFELPIGAILRKKMERKTLDDGQVFCRLLDRREQCSHVLFAGTGLD